MVGKKDKKMNRDELIKFAGENTIGLYIVHVENFDVEKNRKRADFYEDLQKILGELTYDEKLQFLKKMQEDVNEYKLEDLKNSRLKRERKKEDQLRLDNERADKFKASIKPGMIIKVKGTSDGKGYRLVLETKPGEVVCRKLSVFRGKFEKENYITQHYWNKVTKILVENLDENHLN